MKSLWNNNEAKKYKTDLDLRVYSSRLLGQESSLVLHGGGNTSVKSHAINLFGESEEILYVKGSGWDLATIEAEGFAPVKMDMLLKMAELKELSDTDMVKYQRLAMTNPSAPNPSVEAILHAIIPFKFVDHTHTDAVVTITNTEGGADKIKEIYGNKVLVIPYIMPGFVLAKLVYDMTRDVEWSKLDGMVLMNHGLFTFSDDAKESYEKTIELVSKAEDYLVENGCGSAFPNRSLGTSEDNKTVLETGATTLVVPKSLNDKNTTKVVAPAIDFSSSHAPAWELTTSDLIVLAKIRKEISTLKTHATISILNNSPLACSFANEDVQKIATQGPLTPDHVIRTKRTPAILGDDFKTDLAKYIKDYEQYFLDNKTDETMLNPAPNFAILKGKATLSFGKNAKEANIIKDINEHTFEAILKAEKLGGYKALSAKNIFEVEYWSLEQAKLKKSGSSPEFSGKIALITDGMSEVGLVIAKMLNSKGCAVVVLDTNSKVENMFDKADMIGVQCDLTSSADIQKAVEVAVKNFGGIDILVSLGNFSDETNQQLTDLVSPFLKLGIDSSTLRITSKKDSYYIKKDDNFTLEVKKSLNDMAELVCVMAAKVFDETMAC